MASLGRAIVGVAFGVRAADALERARELAAGGLADADAVDSLARVTPDRGVGWVAQEALAVAALCARRYPADAERALRAAVTHHGRTRRGPPAAGRTATRRSSHGARPADGSFGRGARGQALCDGGPGPSLTASGPPPFAMRYLCLFLVLALAACDSNDPPDDTPLDFQGTDVEARGDARLSVSGGRLVVSNIGSSGADGVFVRGDVQSLDMETEPIQIPEGGAFGIRVEDMSGAVIGGMMNEDRPGDDGHDFIFEYADALGVQAVSVSYELGGVVQFRIPRLNLGTPKNGRRQASAGSGSGDSGSVHTVRENGRYVVVSDSGDDAPKTGCAGFSVTPPPPFDRDLDTALCADWVEVTPLSGSFPGQIGGVAVVGRGLGSFVATLLASEW